MTKRPWIEYRTNDCPDQPRFDGGTAGVGCIVVALGLIALGILVLCLA